MSLLPPHVHYSDLGGRIGIPWEAGESNSSREDPAESGIIEESDIHKQTIIVIRGVLSLGPVLPRVESAQSKYILTATKSLITLYTL